MSHRFICIAIFVFTLFENTYSIDLNSTLARHLESFKLIHSLEYVAERQTVTEPEFWESYGVTTSEGQVSQALLKISPKGFYLDVRFSTLGGEGFIQSHSKGFFQHLDLGSGLLEISRNHISPLKRDLWNTLFRPFCFYSDSDVEVQGGFLGEVLMISPKLDELSQPIPLKVEPLHQEINTWKVTPATTCHGLKPLFYYLVTLSQEKVAYPISVRKFDRTGRLVASSESVELASIPLSGNRDYFYPKKMITKRFNIRQHLVDTETALIKDIKLNILNNHDFDIDASIARKIIDHDSKAFIRVPTE